jgi:cation diffusion facilitator CzcD-associated flavoprotein CzcO
VDVCIVGGGFSGLGMAIRLLEKGNDDFVVLERGHDVGGNLALQHLPRLRLRHPVAPLLLFLCPNPEWSQTYSLQPEIRAYLHRVADHFGVRP